MANFSRMLALACITGCITSVHGEQDSSPIAVSSTPISASDPIPESFVSFSIEFAFFPDFAGNASTPNNFSNNLLDNIGNLIGTKPYIRVGGNTQDYALYNSSLISATNGTYNTTRSSDYPTTLYFGPSFFESYSTFPNTKFTHGFNLALAFNSTAGLQNILDSVPLACKALSNGNLLDWEFGNEPDLYVTSSQGPTRPTTWHEPQYVAQWLNGTRAIKDELAVSCPAFASNDSVKWIAPSFAGTNNYLKPLTAWTDGLDADQDIDLYSIHNYINGATSPGVTLQGTLMNHTSNIHASAGFLALLTQLSELQNTTTVPFILGETNSLYNEGAPGLSNAFGAALWGVDFNLYVASQGVRRVHMHQGTDYRYAAWQPIETNKTSIGTKPPYYGNILVAAMLGNLTEKSVQIANFTLDTDFDSAYAAYADGKLERIAVLNLREYNYTIPGTNTLNPIPRPNQTYTFQIPEGCTDQVGIQRLFANGSDALSGITWDGWSYNWELDEGRPVRLTNVTIGETAKAENGTVSVVVSDSQAVILNFNEISN